MRHPLVYAAVLLLLVPLQLALADPAPPAPEDQPAPPPKAAALYKNTLAKWQQAQHQYKADEAETPEAVRKAAEEGLPSEYGHFILPRQKDGGVDESPNGGMIFAAQYYTVVAKPGSLAGQVVDEANHPIPFATVSARTEFYSGHYAAYYGLRPVQADAQGRFTFEHVALASYQLRPRAVGFAGSDSGLVAVTKDAPAATVTLKMRVAGTIRGTVIAANGKPAARVPITVSAISHDNNGRSYGNFGLSTTSDSDGRFEIPVEEDGRYTLSVEPKGATADMPGAATIVPDLAIGQDTTIRLLNGGAVAGRVVNRDDGSPMAHVKVTAEVEFNRADSYVNGYSVQTDGDGRYSFSHLATTYKDEHIRDQELPRVWVISFRGFQASVTPTEGTVTNVPDLAVTPFDKWTLSGRVTSTDGEPVTPFKLFVQQVDDEDGAYISWRYARPKTITATDGSFSMPMNNPGRPVIVRIEAKDFTPYVSPKITPEAAKVLDVQMSIAQSVAGTVLDATGQPAAGVDVALSRVGFNLVYFRNGKFDPDGAVLLVKTDDHGRFMMEAQAEPYVLFATSDAGYASRLRDEMEQSHELKLQPWAKIDGTVLVGGKPAAGVTVGIDHESYIQRQDPKHPQTIWMYESKTNDQGKFHFDRVLPGEATVSQHVSTSMGGGMRSVARAHSVKVVARPGETATVVVDVSDSK